MSEETKCYKVSFCFNFDGYASKDCEFYFRSKKEIADKFLKQKIKNFLAVNRPWETGKILNIPRLEWRIW